MRFLSVPDALPSPQAYLRAGLPCPTAPPAGWKLPENRTVAPTELPDLTELHPESSHGGRSFTVMAESGEPIAVVWAQSLRYLARPARRSAVGSEILGVERHPSGVLSITRGAREPLLPPERPQPVDVATARVVTIDQSVVMAGLDPALFAPDDALFVSAAIPLELAVTIGLRPATNEVSTLFRHWDLTVPVPIDEYVLHIYAQLCSHDGIPIGTEPRLERGDLICAATAILYGAPLYTTKKDAYAGLGNGLKTLSYGEVRNTAALTPPPTIDPYTALGLTPPDANANPNP